MSIQGFKTSISAVRALEAVLGGGGRLGPASHVHGQQSLAKVTAP